MRTGAAPLAVLAALLLTVSAAPAAETAPLPRANPLGQADAATPGETAAAETPDAAAAPGRIVPRSNPRRPAVMPATLAPAATPRSDADAPPALAAEDAATRPGASPSRTESPRETPPDPAPLGVPPGQDAAAEGLTATVVSTEGPPSEPAPRSPSPAPDGPPEAQPARHHASMPGDAASLRFAAPRPGLAVPRPNPRRPSAPPDPPAATGAAGVTSTQAFPPADGPSAAKTATYAFVPPAPGLATPRPNPRRLDASETASARWAAASRTSIGAATRRTPPAGEPAETRPDPDAPTRLAALTTLDPRPRPKAPPRAEGPFPAPPGDGGPSEEARLLLLGVHQGPDGRRALIRLADGAVRRVAPGGTIGRWRVADIGPDSVRLATADRFRTLRLP